MTQLIKLLPASHNLSINDCLEEFNQHRMTLEQVLDSLKIALVVGTILSVINQYDSILTWTYSGKDFLRIFLNYLVPFCVASISRAMHIKKEAKKEL